MTLITYVNEKCLGHSSLQNSIRNHASMGDIVIQTVIDEERVFQTFELTYLETKSASQTVIHPNFTYNNVSP